jgi:hypothetical protein
MSAGFITKLTFFLMGKIATEAVEVCTRPFFLRSQARVARDAPLVHSAFFCKRPCLLFQNIAFFVAIEVTLGFIVGLPAPVL